MKRPDVEGIEKRLTKLIGGTFYLFQEKESLELVEWIKELESDQALMIKKFDEDFENAIDFHLEEEAEKKRKNLKEE